MSTTSFLASDSQNVLWDRLSQCFVNASVLRIASAFLAADDEIVAWVTHSPERRAEVIVRLEYSRITVRVFARLDGRCYMSLYWFEQPDDEIRSVPHATEFRRWKQRLSAQK